MVIFDYEVQKIRTVIFVPRHTYLLHSPLEGNGTSQIA